MANAPADRVSVGVRVEGLSETLKAYNKLDKDAKKAAKVEVQKIADLLAGRIRSRAPSDPRYRNLAVSVKSGRDRVPVIRVGQRANPKVSGGGGPRELVIGMEFGASRQGPNAWRFPDRTPRLGRGNEGYWIYPTIKDNQEDIISRWFAAMDKMLDDWSD